MEGGELCLVAGSSVLVGLRGGIVVSWWDYQKVSLCVDGVERKNHCVVVELTEGIVFCWWDRQNVSLCVGGIVRRNNCVLVGLT